MSNLTDSITLTKAESEDAVGGVDDEKLSAFIIARSEIEKGTWIVPEQLNGSIDRLFGTLFFDKIES